jgi:hypothetical protein
VFLALVLRGGDPSAKGTLASVPVWTSFEGRSLSPLPISDLEKSFYSRFPGGLARYSDGRREILVRYVTQKTRRLHPAADCLRGSGFQIADDRPEVVRGQLWHGFLARRDGLARAREGHGVRRPAGVERRFGVVLVELPGALVGGDGDRAGVGKSFRILSGRKLIFGS